MEQGNNEKGIISLFVLFAMLLLLVFCLTFYFIVRNKLQLEESKNLEIKEIYSQDSRSSSNFEYAKNDDIIPIYNIEQLNLVGKGSYLKIDDIIYQCGRGMYYCLKNNIIVDINEDLITGKIGFNDYKFYSSSYHVDKSLYEIYYYIDGTYWKNLAYQKISKYKKMPQNENYLENEFCTIGKNKLFNLNSKYDFMVIWSDKDGNLNNRKIKSQDIKNKVDNLSDIELVREVYSNLKKDDEIYVFVNVGNSI